MIVTAEAMDHIKTRNTQKVKKPSLKTYPDAYREIGQITTITSDNAEPHETENQ